VSTSQAIKAARGLRDILPSERAAWRLVEQAAHRVARRFGYQEIEVPMIEPIELIERGVGADTDERGLVARLDRVERRLRPSSHCRGKRQLASASNRRGGAQVDPVE